MQPVENTNEEQKQGAIAPVEAIRAEEAEEAEDGLVLALMDHRMRAGLPHENGMTVEELVETFTTMGEAPFIRLFTEVAEASGNPTLVKQHLNDFIDKHRVQLDQDVTDEQQADMGVTNIADSVILDQVESPELPVSFVEIAPVEAVVLPLATTATSFEIVLKYAPLPLSAAQVTATVEEPAEKSLKEIAFQAIDVVEIFPKKNIPVATKIVKAPVKELAVRPPSDEQMDTVIIDVVETSPKENAPVTAKTVKAPVKELAVRPPSEEQMNTVTVEVPTEPPEPVLLQQQDEQPIQKTIISTIPTITIAHDETVAVKTEKTVDLSSVVEGAETIAPVVIPVAEKLSVEIKTEDMESAETVIPDIHLAKKIMVKSAVVMPKSVIVSTVEIEKTIPVMTTEVVKTETKSKPFVKQAENLATTVTVMPQAKETTLDTDEIIAPTFFEPPSNKQKIADENPVIVIETVSKTAVINMVTKIDAPVAMPVATVKEMVVAFDDLPEEIISPVVFEIPLEDSVQITTTKTAIEEATIQSEMLTSDTQIIKLPPQKTIQATNDMPARPVIRLQVSVKKETEEIRSNGQGMTTSIPEFKLQGIVAQEPISPIKDNSYSAIFPKPILRSNGQGTTTSIPQVELQEIVAQELTPSIKTRSYSTVFPKPVLTQFNQGAIETQRPQIVETVQAQLEQDRAVNAYADMHKLPGYGIAAKQTTPPSNPAIPFRRVYNMVG